MATVDITLRQAKVFFNQVEDALVRGQVRALKRFGAFVRSDAKKSMRTRRGRLKLGKDGVRRRVHTPSDAGQPPFAIEGHMKRFLFFFVEKDGTDVTIGPIKLARKNKTRTPVPGLHEHGGSQRVKFKGRFVNARYPQRPFMRPAFDKNLPKLDQIMKDLA